MSVSQSSFESRAYIVSFSCPDRRGIIAAASTFLFEQGFNVVESAQFEDRVRDQFFYRTVVEASKDSPDLAHLRTQMQPLAAEFAMTHWDICAQTIRPRVLLMVSKFGHCLNDLLFRQSIGAIQMDIVGVVSNHMDHADRVASYGLPFYHRPVTPETKKDQEAFLIDLIDQTDTNLVVLARYMQVLSPEICTRLSNRVINIHHSFLPSFKGAHPYKKAYDRGVKMVGATAHYVTPDLDEGPIIEQEVARISHANSVDQIVAIGRDLENVVLARAVKAHCENRVFLNGSKTVVFP